MQQFPFSPKLNKKSKKHAKFFSLIFAMTCVVVLAWYVANETRELAALQIIPVVNFLKDVYEWLSLNVFVEPAFKLVLTALIILAISWRSPFLRRRIYNRKNASRIKNVFKFSAKTLTKIFKIKFKVLNKIRKLKLLRKTSGFFKSIQLLFSPVKASEIKKLVDIIESINVQDVRSEEDFEKQLFQRLDAKGYDVKRQVYYGTNNIVDLIVNGQIGVELKVADKAKNVRDLIGQITVYRKHLKHIIVGILDSGDVPPAEMQEYANLIKKVDRRNVHVVMVKGEIKRLKQKEKYVVLDRTSR